MPNVLAKLGADVLGVNPYASTGGIMAFDRWHQAEGVASVVRASGAHLGAVLDPDGEHLTLIDDEGHVLTDDESLFAMVSLVGGHLLGDQIAVPISTSRIIEQLAAENGVKIRYTKISTAALMDAACDPGVGFAAERRRRVHPAGLPAGLRRRGHARQVARAARQGRRARCRRSWPRHRGRTWCTTPSSRRGTARAW